MMRVSLTVLKRVARKQGINRCVLWHRHGHRHLAGTLRCRQRVPPPFLHFGPCVAANGMHV